MKRTLTKLTALLLVLVMALSLCACGSGSSSKSSTSEEETPTNIYNTEFTTIVSGVKNSLNPVLYSGNGFYAVTYKLVEDESEPTEENTEESANETAAESTYAVAETSDPQTYLSTISYVDFSGTVSELVKYAPKTAENTEGYKDFYSGSSIFGMAETSDGKLVTIESTYSSWYEGPDNLTSDDAEYYSYQKYNNAYYLRVLDSEGNELSCVTLDVDENEGISIGQALTLDDNDNVILGMGDSVCVIGLDGQQVMKINAAEESSGEYFYIDSIIKLNDGSIAVTTYANGGEELWLLDESTKGFGDKYTLPSSAYGIISGGGNYQLYYTSGTNFYGFNLGDSEATRLFNWINCDINNSDGGLTYVRDDGSIVTVINDYDSAEETYEVSLATVSLVPYDSVPHKEEITLATQYLSWTVRDQVISFNRKNDQYRIVVKDYSQYNTDEDYSAGLTKLTTEILAGNTPDILDLTGLPYTQLAAKGLLEDLYPYMDNDSEFGREDFFPNVLAALEVNGSLYSTASSFYLNSVIGASSVVGDEPGWTYDEFNAALASMPEGCEPFDRYTTRDTILQTCLNLDMDKYVDWTTGKCDFNNESFTELLEFAAQFPETFDWENYDYSNEDNATTRIAQGKQMLMMTSIYSITDIIYNDQYFGGSSTYIGYPTSDGSVGNLITLADSGYAMCSKSTHKDAVWQFLRNFFTEKGQSSAYAIPTNINVYNSRLKESMTVQYEKDDNGQYKLDKDGNKIPVALGSYTGSDGKTVKFYSITQEQADKLYQALTSATALNDYTQNSIFTIVKEQSQAYFEGQKTAEEVAKLVQSKANIYVNEQR